jgi:predicted nucleotidyltransferase
VKNIGEVSVSVDPLVRQAARRLADATSAIAVILFGSRARGEFKPDSDWDLCVVVPDDVKPGQFTSVSLWSTIAELVVPIQVVPIRKSIFEAKKDDINSLSHDVYQDGVVLESAQESSPAP